MTNTQQLLVLGGMLILSLVALRFNSSVLQTKSIEVENKVYLTAFSLADDMIEEIKGKAFDEATIKFPTAIENLTSPDALGPEPGEVYPNYNDVDDYNGYTKVINAPHVENYHVTCSVNYVSPSSPDTDVLYRTYYKKLTVTVSSPYLTHTVSESFIFTLK